MVLNSIIKLFESYKYCPIRANSCNSVLVSRILIITSARLSLRAVIKQPVLGCFMTAKQSRRGPKREIASRPENGVEHAVFWSSQRQRVQHPLDQHRMRLIRG